MLPTIIILILMYLLYRSVRPGRPWLLPWIIGRLQRKLSHKMYQAHQPNTQRPQNPEKIIDEMKACPQCGTYNLSQIALVKKGLYFCNRECHEAYQTQHQEVL